MNNHYARTGEEVKNNPYILLVEDNTEILKSNRDALLAEGYEVSTAETVRQAQEKIAEKAPDLMIMDILLPDGSGLDLCREIREATAAPILFLTVLKESDQIVQGLRSGGDDYITKPYEMAELLARVAAQLRRTELVRNEQRRDLRIGPLTLDLAAGRASVEERDLLLKPKEFLLLSTLVRAQSRFLSAEQIYREVWGMHTNEDVRTVLVHVSSLRSKLKRSSADFVRIERVSDKGFRLQMEAE